MPSNQCPSCIGEIDVVHVITIRNTVTHGMLFVDTGKCQSCHLRYNRERWDYGKVGDWELQIGGIYEIKA